jgi:spore coat polysaccharide biosynthesis predicted glycosyltransferase SpsG
VLVTLGGGDSGNVTADVLEVLAAEPRTGLEVMVVVGAANPNHHALESATRGSHLSVRIVRSVADMAALMAWADVAISAAGSTCWELAFMGVPSILIVRASNQAGIAAALSAQGFGLSLGPDPGFDARLCGQALAGLLDSRAVRIEFTRVGQALVDGKGSHRVVDAMASW